MIFRAWRYSPETIPSRFVRLGKIPLTLNGKVNEEALPDPWVTEEAESGTPAARELSETEQVLAGGWSQVLGVKPDTASQRYGRALMRLRQALLDTGARGEEP